MFDLWLRRCLRIVLVCLALFVAAGVLAYWYARRALPRLDGTVHVPGLIAPVRIVRDDYGRPHITADNDHDLLEAEGYAMAQDRLWQMDLMRRVGGGRLAEIFGEQAVKFDIASRRLGLAQAAARESALLSGNEKAALAAFCAGVNAYIQQRGRRLPLEFKLLGYRPAPWRPRDCLLIAAQMYRSLTTSYRRDLQRERFLRALGPELTAQLYPSKSVWDVIPGEWAGPTPHRDVALRRLRLPKKAATGASVTTTSAAMAVGGGDATQRLWQSLMREPRGRDGSNNWMLAPERSLSGHALLANDPHLMYQMPGIWWAVDLAAPGMHVAGVALAGIPAVVIGHNEHIAWGVTVTGADVQDLVREPASAARVVREEIIAVHGAAPRTIQVSETGDGPLVVNSGRGAMALRWTLYSPGALRLTNTFLQLAQAENWGDFEAALSGYNGPVLNFGYADQYGNIGFQCAGRIPLRKGFDGSIPLRAGRARQWSGWVPFARMPRAYDPQAGVLATANGRVLPHGSGLFSAEWDAPYRTRRIYEILASRPRWSLAQMASIQMDSVSDLDRYFAARVVAAAGRHPRIVAQMNAAARRGLQLLSRFHGNMRADSVAAGFEYRLRRQFLLRVLSAKAGALATQYHWLQSAVFEQELLRARPPQWLPPNAQRGWDGVLLQTLNDYTRLVPEAARQPWGKGRQLHVAHPIFTHIPLLRSLADAGPVPVNGSHLTIQQRTPKLGPSMRMAVDTGDWDQTRLTLFSGESGELGSAHYRDEFAAYLHGRNLPFWFSAAAVARHSKHVLQLQPDRMAGE